MADLATDDVNLDELFKADVPTDVEPKGEADRARDEAGRFAAKQEADAKAETPTADAPDEPEVTTRHVPLRELQSERGKRKEETRLRTEAEARVAVYEKQLQTLMQQQRQPQAQPQPIQAPDPVIDPEGYVQHQQQVFQQQILNERANFSEMRARDKFGDQLVEAALAAAPENIRREALQRPDPYGELIRWHKQSSFMTKVGEDPDAYEKQVEERTRAAVLADLKAGKIKLDGKPVPATRFPGTLADQTSASAQQTAHLTDDAMMADVFARRR